jgi:hypothetical protein
VTRGAARQIGAADEPDPTASLAYLNACEGALASGGSVFTGVAQALVREGVPAAVAMQAEISDPGAGYAGRWPHSRGLGGAAFPHQRSIAGRHISLLPIPSDQDDELRGLTWRDALKVHQPLPWSSISNTTSPS